MSSTADSAPTEAQPPSAGRPKKAGSGKSRTPCKYFATSAGCRNGSDCHFDHSQPAPAAEPGAASDSFSPQAGRRQRPSDNRSRTVKPPAPPPSATQPKSHRLIVCKFWLDQACMRGDSCTFMHALADGVTSPSKKAPSHSRLSPSGAASGTPDQEVVAADNSQPRPGSRLRSREPASQPSGAPKIAVVKSPSSTAASTSPPVQPSSSLSAAFLSAESAGKSAPPADGKKQQTKQRLRSQSHIVQTSRPSDDDAATPVVVVAAVAAAREKKQQQQQQQAASSTSFSRVCRFWGADACRKGPECLFIHPGEWTIGATLRPQNKLKQQRLDRQLFAPLVEGDAAGVQKWLAEHPLAGLEVIASSAAVASVSGSASSESIRGSSTAVQTFQQISDGLYIAALLGATDICRALFERLAASPLLTVANEPRDPYYLQNLLRRVAHLATGEPGTPNHYDAAAAVRQPVVIPSASAVAASNQLRGVGKDTPLTPIDAAAFNGSVPIVAFMLDAGVKDRLGTQDALAAEQFRRAPTTVLQRACSRANLELVRYLLQRVAGEANGAEKVVGYINEATPLRRSTALHFAAASSDRRPKVGPQACDVVQLLINYGVDINAADCSDMTALLFAAGKAPLQMIRALLEAGAVPLPADDGYSPLTATIRAERVDSVKLLLAAGADPNNAAGQGGGWLPLAAVRSDREPSLEILHLLMQHGANVHLIGSVDRLLVGKQCPKAAAVLLGYGAPLGEAYQFMYTMNDYLDGPARQPDEVEINALLVELTAALRRRLVDERKTPTFPATDAATLFVASGSLADALAEQLEAPAAGGEHRLARFLPELRAGKATCCGRCHQWFFGAPACKRRLRARHPGAIGRAVYSVIDIDFCSADCWKRSYIAGSIQLESIGGHLQDKMSLAELLASGDPEKRRIHVLYKFKNDLSTAMYELYLAPSQFSLEGLRSQLQHGTLQPPPEDVPGEALVFANLDTWHPYTNLSFAVACQEQSELMIGLDYKPLGV